MSSDDGDDQGEPIDEDELLRVMVGFYEKAGGTAIAATVEERRVDRGRRLFRLYARPDLWHELETSLRTATAIADTLATSASPVLARVAVLAERVRGDVEEAFDALLVGVEMAASNAMRDVMEAELLVRWFAADPSIIDEWADADRQTLVDRFSPARVRSAVAAAVGLTDRAQLPDAWEYEVHSHNMHVSADEHVARGKRPSGTLDDLEPITLEIVEHVKRYADAVDGLFAAVGEAAPARADFRALDDPLAALVGDVIPTREPRTRAERRRLEREMRKRKA